MRLTWCFIILVGMVGPSQALQEQSGSLGVDLHVREAPTTCVIQSEVPLDFGQWIRPETGTGHAVHADPVGDAIDSSTLLRMPAETSLGALTLSVEYAANYTIEAAFTENWIDGKGNSLPFAGEWAVSEDQINYVALAPGQVRTSGADARGTTTHYFRFGGTLSDIEAESALSEYTGEIDVQVSCV